MTLSQKQIKSATLWLVLPLLLLCALFSAGLKPVKAANPTIASVATQDANHNGKLDGYKLHFSTTMDKTVTSTTGFTVTDYTIGSTGTWSSDGYYFTLPITEDSSYDTGVIPALSYNASLGGIKDASSNVLNTVANSAIDKNDNAEPVLLSATAIPTTYSSNGVSYKKVNLVWSESVQTFDDYTVTTTAYMDNAFDLAGGHSWGDSGLDVYGVAIYLYNGGVRSAAIGDTITVNIIPNQGIQLMDCGGSTCTRTSGSYNDAASATVTLTGSFGTWSSSSSSSSSSKLKLNKKYVYTATYKTKNVFSTDQIKNDIKSAYFANDMSDKLWYNSISITGNVIKINFTYKGKTKIKKSTVKALLKSVPTKVLPAKILKTKKVKL